MWSTPSTAFTACFHRQAQPIESCLYGTGGRRDAGRPLSRSAEFAISSLAEAAAYLAHPLLGSRLRECSALMLATRGRTAEAILGRPDDVKFHSSMTLFAQVPGAGPAFAACLEKYFGGALDPHTLSRI